LEAKVLRRISASLLVTFMVLSAAVWAQTNPAAVFSDFDGQPRSIESYTANDHWLVVMIWASDCHVCNAEAESYAQFHEANADKGIRVLGVSLDGEAGKAAARAFVERHDLPFPNLIGEPGMVGRYYSALTQSALRGTPSIMVFDPQGNLAAAQAGAVTPDAIESYIAKKNQAPAAG
jgi:peroxiredoxin